jgi:hypothetical protein
LHRYFVNEIYPPLGNRWLAEVTALDIQQIVFAKETTDLKLQQPISLRCLS